MSDEEKTEIRDDNGRIVITLRGECHRRFQELIVEFSEVLRDAIIEEAIADARARARRRRGATGEE